MRILGYLPMAAQRVMLWGSAATLAVYLIVLMLLIAVLTAYILAALHLLRKGKQDETQTKSVAGTSAHEPRFSNLSRIDVQQKQQPAVSYVQRDLQQICEEFRNFAASELGLYYDIADIRRLSQAWAWAG